MKKILVRICSIVIIVLPIKTAFGDSFSLTGQLNAGAGYSKNPFEKESNTQFVSELNNRGFTITEIKPASKFRYDLFLNMRKDFDSIGLGVNTGIMYQKSSVVTYMLDADAVSYTRYKSNSFMFPVDLYAEYRLKFNEFFLLHLGGGPGIVFNKQMYSFDQYKAFPKDSGKKISDYEIEIKQLSQRAASLFAFATCTVKISQNLSINSGVHGHFISFKGTVYPVTGIFVGISEYK